MHHKIAFIDLDGTINSSNKYRAHLVPVTMSKEENWRAWHAAHVNEEPNWAVIETVKALREAGWIIVFLSMRTECAIDTSAEQLNRWVGGRYSLITKSEGDHRKAGRYKTDEIMSRTTIAHHRNGERIDILVIDDSAEVCGAVRAVAVPSNIRINVMQITPFTGE